MINNYNYIKTGLAYKTIRSGWRYILNSRQVKIVIQEIILLLFACRAASAL